MTVRQQASKAVIFLLLLLIVPQAREARTYGEASIKNIIAVYDGDTFRANLEGFPAIIGENIGIRINGIDTPEMKDKRPHIKALAIKARNYLRARLKEAKEVKLISLQRGKYFRIVAQVIVDGQDIGQELIKAGLAKPYSGGKKEGWK